MKPENTPEKAGDEGRGCPMEELYARLAALEKKENASTWVILLLSCAVLALTVAVLAALRAVAV